MRDALAEKMTYELIEDLVAALDAKVPVDELVANVFDALAAGGHAKLIAWRAVDGGDTVQNPDLQTALFSQLMETAQGTLAPDQGRDDHISVMLRTEAEGKPLSLASIIGTTHTLLVTGVEVVTLAVANTIYYLWQNPDQRARVAADPALAKDAFWEALRYDMPTNMLGRVVKKTWSLHGQTLEPGAKLMFLWHCANHDEREFPDPDRFDIARQAPRILSFGHATHRCLGANIAQMEGRVLIQELIAKLPERSRHIRYAMRALADLYAGLDAQRPGEGYDVIAADRRAKFEAVEGTFEGKGLKD